MEQQKILWIIFSVTFFLAAVVVGGLILLKPGSTKSAADNGVSTEAGELSEVSPYNFGDLLNGDQELPAAPGTEEDGSFDVSEDTAEGTGGEINPDLKNALDNTQIEITTGRDIRSSENRTGGTASSSAASSTQVVKQPQATTTRTSRNTSAAAVTQAKPQPKLTVDYWIQLASYTKKSSAEATLEELQDEGVTAVIFTAEINSATWYRLRVGPYRTESEAKKFQEWLKKLDGYDNTVIFQEQVKR